jgi:hypothetical protein
MVTVVVIIIVVVVQVRVMDPLKTQVISPPLGPCILKPDLKDPLGQIGLLRKGLEVFRIGVLIDGKVLLHRPELVMFEGGSHSLGPSRRTCEG